MANNFISQFHTHNDRNVSEATIWFHWLFNCRASDHKIHGLNVASYLDQGVRVDETFYEY